MEDYKNISEDSIRKVLDGMDFPKMGKLTPEEIAQKRAVLGSFAMDAFGDEVYQLPGGALTGKGGWDMFLEELKKAANNNYKTKTK